MEVVFLCGDRSSFRDDPVRRAILQNTGGRPVRITAAETVPAGAPGVVLLKNSALLPAAPRFPPGSIPVFDGENRRAAAFLRRTGACGVDYGTAPRATVSLSSMGERSATVSLQRNVVTVSGRVLEPCEVPVTLGEKMSPRQVLSAVAVLLLADVPWENGYHF